MTRPSIFHFPGHWMMFSLIGCFMATMPSIAADGIQWRTDYNAARKEAIEKGRPIFIDFGTEECFHCRRLEASTFRDAMIINLLNQRFIPLKVDGNVEVNLVQALRIQAYPTLIIAGTDGKIVGMIEGYMEASRLLEHLNRGLSQSTPDWMARDFQEASKSYSNGDFARSITMLKTILEDGKDRPIQGKAKQILDEIEQQAVGRLSMAKKMHDQGQSLEASDILTDMLKRYPGTVASNEGAQYLTKLSDAPALREGIRVRRSKELLAQARNDFEGERYFACLEACELLGSTYKDMPEAKEAQQLTSDIHQHPDRMDRVVSAMNDRLATMYTIQGEAWMKRGNTEQARASFDRAVKASPASTTALTAQRRLTEIVSPNATQQTEFQKAP